MKKQTRILITTISTLLIVSIILYLLFNKPSIENKPIENTPTNQTQQNESEDTDILKPYIDSFASNKAINNDYVGHIVFESELIIQPVVQYIDNDYYLRRNWITNQYDIYGTVFVDYESKKDSQNYILYGHHAINKENATPEQLMFTLLDELKDANNYEKNKFIYMIFEDEIRKYEIAHVYQCDLIGTGEDSQPNPNLLYYLPEYNEKYFEIYINEISKVEYYKTGVTLSNTDKLLTLQTCVANRDDLRLIVIAKQVDVTKIGE